MPSLLKSPFLKPLLCPYITEERCVSGTADLKLGQETRDVEKGTSKNVDIGFCKSRVRENCEVQGGVKISKVQYA